MSDRSSPVPCHHASRSLQRRTALLVVLSLILGLVGTAGAPSGAGAAVERALVARWTFDAGSGTTAADSVGKQQLSLKKGAGWAAGRL
jgi:hypothetical protein